MYYFFLFVVIFLTHYQLGMHFMEFLELIMKVYKLFFKRCLLYICEPGTILPKLSSKMLSYRYIEISYGAVDFLKEICADI